MPTARSTPGPLRGSQRYLVLGILAFSLALAYGIWYAYSVILVALLREYGWSRSVLAGAFSLFTVVHGLANPLVGRLCDRFRPLALMAAGGALVGAALWACSTLASPLQLYLLFGVCTALSVCIAGWTPALVQVQRDFPDRLGLALGIVSSGVGVGMLLVVPLAQFLIDAYGWRSAFRVLGTLCAAWIVPSSLYLLRRPAARRAASPAPGAAGRLPPATSLDEVLHGQAFWLMLAVFFLGNFCSQTLHVHQVAYLVDLGVPAIVGASVVGVVGVASIVGKTGGGWLSDRIERELIFLAGIVVMLAAVAALAAMSAAPARWAIYGYAVLLGLGYSVTAALVPAMVSDRFSGPHFGTIVGMGLLSSALGSATGPWLAGFLFDRTGSYAIAFPLAGAGGLAAGIAVWRARALRLRSLSRNRAEPG
jgi:MFS family permease